VFLLDVAGGGAGWPFPEAVDRVPRVDVAACAARPKVSVRRRTQRSVRRHAQPGLADLLREKRIKSRDGDDLIEVVIRRLRAAS
jgi:hypothetical protein